MDKNNIHPSANDNYVQTVIDDTPFEESLTLPDSTARPVKDCNDRGTHGEEWVYNTYTSTPLYVALRPLMVSLKLGGLFHARTYQLAEAGDGHFVEKFKTCCQKPNKKYSTGFSWSHIYSIVILFVHVMNVVRICFMFNSSDSFHPVTFGKVVFLAWLLLCVCNNCNMYGACACYKALPSFFMTWKRLHQQPNTVCLAKLKGKTVLYTIIGWILVILNTLFAIYGLWWSFIFDHALVPLHPNHPSIIYFKITYTVIHFYLSISWMFTAIYIFILVIIVHHEFRHFNDTFRACLKIDGTFSGDLEMYRQQHQSLCTLVKHADNSSSFYTGTVMVCSITQCLLILYNVIYWQVPDSMVVLMKCFWLVSCMLILFLLAFGGATVNHVVSKD